MRDLKRRPFTPLAVVLFVPSNNLPSQNSRKEAASEKVKGCDLDPTIWLYYRKHLEGSLHKRFLCINSIVLPSSTENKTIQSNLP